MQCWAYKPGVTVHYTLLLIVVVDKMELCLCVGFVNAVLGIQAG